VYGGSPPARHVLLDDARNTRNLTLQTSIWGTGVRGFPACAVRATHDRRTRNPTLENPIWEMCVRGFPACADRAMHGRRTRGTRAHETHIWGVRVRGLPANAERAPKGAITPARLRAMRVLQFPKRAALRGCEVSNTRCDISREPPWPPLRGTDAASRIMTRRATSSRRVDRVDPVRGTCD